MSTPASELGSIASGTGALGGATPVAATPVTGTANANPPGATTSSNWLSALNPFAGATSFLPNVGLIIFGVVLVLGALLVSQKDTVVKVATTAAEV